MKKIVGWVILAPVVTVVLIIASVSIVLDWAFDE